MARRSKKITTDKDLARLCRSELERSDGGEHINSALKASQVEALQYYHARERLTIKNRSSALSSDVPDVADALQSQIMLAFSGDNVAVFEPMGPDDESQAELESKFVNNQVMEAGEGWLQIHQAVKDALLLKYGVVAVEAVERDVVSHRTLFKQPAEVLAGLEMAETAQGESVKILRRRDAGDGLFDADVRVSRLVRSLEIRAVPAEDLRVWSGHTSIQLDDCRFCAERVANMTRSRLISDGFSREVVDKLPSNKVYTLDRVKSARWQTGRIPDTETLDVAQEEVETFICYARVDRDNDGVAELLRIVYAGKQVLEAKEVDWVPYATGVVMLDSFRFAGTSVHEKIKGIEDIKTQLLRQGLENTVNANYPRSLAVKGQVDMDSLMTPRPNGVVEVKSPDAVTPIIVPDMSDGIIGWLEYLDKVRSERGGAALDLQAAEAQLVGDTAQGIERQYQSRELRAGLMAKTLAETLIRSIYLLVHRTYRTQLPGSVTLQLAGKWIETDPSQWMPRDRVNVTVGLSPAERIRKKAALQQNVMLQAQAMQAGKGGELVDDSGMYQCMMDLGHASELENPEKYWIDPASPEAQQVKQQKQQAQQQQVEQQMVMQNNLAKITVQIEKMKDQTDKDSNRVDVYKAQLDATTKIALAIAEASGQVEQANAALDAVQVPAIGGTNGSGTEQ